MSSRFLFLLLGTAVLASVSTTAAQTPRQATALRPGDAVRITVWRDSELSGEFPVGPDGGLVHPVYRALKVGGVALPDLDARIRTFLLRYQTEPQFVAQPLLRVTIAGEVEKPALYFLGPDVTIAQAVALAGGSRERGRTDRVRLLSDGRIQSVKLDGRDPMANLPVRSGDQLMIERRGSLFRDVVGPLIGIVGSAAAIITVTRDRR
jgi:protein involved in polysaccharide export with SLBB domain